MELIEGGDRGCGELLLVLAARVRTLDPGSEIRLVTTDAAAGVDLPAWCRLTGHHYLGRGLDAGGRPYYDLQMSDRSHGTSDAPPRRLDPEPSQQHQREEHP